MRLVRGGRILVDHLLAVLIFSVLVPFVVATFRGSCYETYGIAIGSCDQLDWYCYNKTCNTVNDDIYFTCFGPYWCNGSYISSDSMSSSSDNTGSSVDSSSSSSVNNTGNCDLLTFRSCDEAPSAFDNIDCTDYYCSSTTSGYLYATCYDPFRCHVSLGKYGDEKPMNDADYQMVWAVYLAAAFTLVAIAVAVRQFRPSETNKELSLKAVVETKMPTIVLYLYRVSLAAFVCEDGSAMGFINFFAQEKDFFGFIDCRKNRNTARPRWMRICAVLTTWVILESLAFSLGSVLHNTEDCWTYLSTSSPDYNGTGCEANNGVGITCFLTAIALTLLVSQSGSITINSAKDGSKRQKLLHVATIGTVAALILFGVLYCDRLVDADVKARANSNARRMDTIWIFLLWIWVGYEVTSIGILILQWMFCWVCYRWLYKPKLQSVKHSRSVVRPKGPSLDSSIGVKCAPSNVPSNESAVIEAQPTLDKASDKIDGIRAWGGTEGGGPQEAGKANEDTATNKTEGVEALSDNDTKTAPANKEDVVLQGEDDQGKSVDTSPKAIGLSPGPVKTNQDGSPAKIKDMSAPPTNVGDWRKVQMIVGDVMLQLPRRGEQ